MIRYELRCEVPDVYEIFMRRLRGNRILQRPVSVVRLDRARRSCFAEVIELKFRQKLLVQDGTSD